MSAIPLKARCRIQRRDYETTCREERRGAVEDTPYGPLVDSVEADSVSGPEPIKVSYIGPAALLWQTAQHSARFLALLVACGLSHSDDALPAGLIALYLDDVVPGNALRADGGRKYVAIYWALVNLPSWYLSSQYGWFPLCFLPRKVYLKIKGGMSQLCRILLRAFFAPKHGLGNFMDGLVLTHAAQPGAVLFKAKFWCWLADADAIPAISGCKTTSGTHPCGCCRYIVARCTPDEIPIGSALVHYTCDEVER